MYCKSNQKAKRRLNLHNVSYKLLGIQLISFTLESRFSRFGISHDQSLTNKVRPFIFSYNAAITRVLHKIRTWYIKLFPESFNLVYTQILTQHVKQFQQ